MRVAETTSYNIRSTPYFLFPAFVKNTSVFISEKMDAYGDFFEVKVPGHEILDVANADVLQHILVRNETNYIKSRYYWQQLKAIIGNALGTLEGDEWLLLKKLHTKALGNAKTTTYLLNINADIHNYLHQWKAYENSTVDIIALCSEMNVAILLQALFGYENKAICTTIASLIGAGQKHILWRSKYPWRPFLSNISGKDNRYDSSLLFFENLAKDVFENRTCSTDDTEN
ncbi:MAG: cytochrome P450 [Agriterribacter sp.]